MDAKTAERADTGPRGERGVPRDRHDQVRLERPPEEPRSSLRDSLRRHPYAAGGSALVVLLLLAAAFAWWLHARNYETTDDAFIDTRTVTIASQLAGTIVRVPVTDNEQVPAGATLVEIDP